MEGSKSNSTASSSSGGRKRKSEDSLEAELEAELASLGISEAELLKQYNTWRSLERKRKQKASFSQQTKQNQSIEIEDKEGSIKPIRLLFNSLNYYILDNSLNYNILHSFCFLDSSLNYSLDSNTI